MATHNEEAEGDSICSFDAKNITYYNGLAQTVTLNILIVFFTI
jgi:hypothetical protein